MSEPDIFRVADLLVRFSGVPLPTIASSLGFSELREFSRWFEDRGGRHPETARAEESSFTVEVPEASPSNGHDERCLSQVRQALAWMLEPSATAQMVRAMRRRQPIPPGDRDA